MYLGAGAESHRSQITSSSSPKIILAKDEFDKC